MYLSFYCAPYCRIRLQKTGGSTAENQSSSETPERLGDELRQVSFTPDTVLSVRFVAREYRRGVEDSDKDDEELDTDQGQAAATASLDAPANDAADDDDDDDVSTPGQVDWVVVTSHADNTIRFRNAEASYYAI